MKRQFLIIYTGFNQRAVVSFLRSISTLDIEPLLIARSPQDSIFDSIYAKNVIHTRKDLDLRLEDLISLLRSKNLLETDNRFILAPSSEALNLFFLENRTKLSSYNITAPLVELELYRQISDKLPFSTLCEKNGVVVPETLSLADITYPCVAKPKTYEVYDDNSRLAPVILKTEEDFNTLLNPNQVDQYYFQEFVEGQSYYLLYYIDKAGYVQKYSQKNLVQQSGGKSIVAATVADLHMQSISSDYERILKELKFRGLIMIELIEKRGKFYMIEANPRMWGPSQLFVDAGINFFHDLLLDYDFIREKPIETEESGKDYSWYGGIQWDWNNQNKLHYYTNKKAFLDNINYWESIDIYNREDTEYIYKKEKKMDSKSKLIELYANTSKHSNYQILAPVLQDILKQDEYDVRSRFEKERIEFMSKYVTFDDASSMDIGANTGYFTFEALRHGAQSVQVHEGNQEHANFISVASDAVDLASQISVDANYYEFDQSENKYDIAIVLNVLHHIGDDYGNPLQDRDLAKEQILNQLEHLSKVCKTLIFQLGFCWQGNIEKPLFENGTKAEMIEFIQEGCKDFFSIEHIGIAERDEDGQVEYRALSEENIERQDSLGEFLNRPLFIMKSLN